jgi:hypothetical protein
MNEVITPPILRRNGMPKLNRARASGDLILKALIFSEDASTLAKAESTLLRVGSRPEVDALWIIKSWPVNALTRAGLAKEALIEAADTHLVILPFRRAHSFPSWLQDSFHQWAGLRKVPDAAVAVISDGARAEFSRPVSPELARLVLQHNLNLVIEQVPAIGNSKERPVRPPIERELPLLLQRHRSNDAVASSPFRSFGINE